MANTYTQIERVVVGAGGQATVQFNNIPQTYTHLKMLISARSTHSAATWILIEPNGSSSNLSTRRLEGYGASGYGMGTTSTGFVGYLGGTNYLSNTFAEFDVHIPNYRSSQNKTFFVDNVSGNDVASEWYINNTAGLWIDTSVISSITLRCNSGNFAEHSTITLYGLKSTIAIGAKGYGGAVYEDANYWYHSFLSTGTFVPTQNLTADVLVVAGGGGGGCSGGGVGGGGAGAGGLVYLTGQSLTSGTSYSITVGAGGIGGAYTGGLASTSGSNSQFASQTAAIGGGRGGHGGNVGGSADGGNGGSGGGSCYVSSGVRGTAGTGTAGQGTNGGGSYAAASSDGGGGGGGFSSSGATSGATSGGVGGNGTSTYSSWGLATNSGSYFSGSYYYAAGGGGGGRWTDASAGAGGTSGGGRGSIAGNGNPGVRYSGSGGGGGGVTQASGGSGGSGIVIIRYTK